MSERANSRSSRSWTISMCSSPRKPQRNPKPSASEVSGSAVNEEAFRRSFSTASRSASYCGVAARRRDLVDGGLQDLVGAGPLLGAREDRLRRVEADHLLDLLARAGGIGAREIDLVEHVDDRQVVTEGQVDVGDRLRLHALG